MVTGVAVIGLALALLPLRTALLLVGVGIAGPLVLLRPYLILYILIPIIPFSSLLAVQTGGFKIGLMEASLAFGLAAGLLNLLARPNWTGQEPKLNTGPLLIPFLLFLGGMGLTWLKALSIGASLVETAKWVEMFILYLFVFNLLPPGQIKWAAVSLILAGLAQAVLGLYQFIFKVGPEGFLLFDGSFLRAYGTFAQPNPYAGYLGLVLPLILSLAIWGFRPLPASLRLGRAAAQVSDLAKENKSVAGWPGRPARLLALLSRLSLLALPFGLLLGALFASQSRGAWLGFAAAAVITLVSRNKQTAMLLASLALVGVLVGLAGAFDLSPGQGGRADSNTPYRVILQRFVDAISTINLGDIATAQVTDANFATIERLAHWQAAREMWRDNLWLGVGFGNYAVIYPAYAVGRWLDPLGHAHNYLLNLGAETGLAGITLYLIFWIFSFRVLWIAVRRSSGFEQAVACGGLGIIIHLHVHNLVDNLYVQGMYLHIAIVLGLSSIIYEQYRRPSTPMKSRESLVVHH
jgi:O-antigen ligase